MKKFPFIPGPASIQLLRIVVALMLAAHGISRLQAGTVNDFGDFLDSKGIVIGRIIAWALSFFEVIGGVFMAAGYFVRPIAAVFMVELIMGIILVHAKNGWFVVGRTLNGVEYSVLLLFTLIVIAANSPSKSKATRQKHPQPAR